MLVYHTCSVSDTIALVLKSSISHLSRSGVDFGMGWWSKLKLGLGLGLVEIFVYLYNYMFCVWSRNIVIMIWQVA